MIDEYGFITECFLPTNKPVGQGDSCFRMGLMAIVHKEAGRDNQARKLWILCKKNDFNRHPTINEASRDGLIPWHYYAARYNKPTWAPKFKKRKGKYAHLPKWKYSFTYQWLSMQFRSKFDNEFINNLLSKWKPGSSIGHYTYHLNILMAATTYEIYSKQGKKWRAKWLLKAMKKYVRKYNKKYGNNIFFNWLCYEPLGELIEPWKSHPYITDWWFQRDSRKELKKHDPNFAYYPMSEEFLKAIGYK